MQPYRGDADVPKANDLSQTSINGKISIESKNIPGSSVGVQDYRSGYPRTGCTGGSDSDAPTVSSCGCRDCHASYIRALYLHSRTRCLYMYIYFYLGQKQISAHIDSHVIRYLNFECAWNLAADRNGAEFASRSSSGGGGTRYAKAGAACVETDGVK